jgi:hypothetical protein
MYRQARFFIRTALVWLALAFVVFALLLLNQGFAIDGRIGAWQPVAYHLLMVGWATQLIAGVALWMFPPFTKAQPRGNEALGWVTYFALNIGLALRVIAEPLNSITPNALFAVMLALSAVLQVAAIWCLVFQLWPRVKGRITPLPEGKPAGKGAE